MQIHDVEQGSALWKQLRLAMVTGTRLERVMGTREAQRALIAELIAEEGTEQGKDIKATSEMERGTAEELFAVKAYEQKTGKKLDRVGMVVSDKYPWLAVSPDGLHKVDNVYVTGGEFKCPDSKKAILYKIENMVSMEETGLAKWSKPTKNNPEPELNILASAPFCGIPSEYKYQVLDYFLCIETLEDVDFCVYDARFIDEDAKLYIVNIRRDNPEVQEELARIEEELLRFRATWLAWKEIVLPTAF